MSRYFNFGKTPLLIAMAILISSCSKNSASNQESASPGVAPLANQGDGVSAGQLRIQSIASSNVTLATKNSCRVYFQACKDAGFELGKINGNRLIGDCLIKLLQGQTAKSSVTGRVAVLPVNGDANDCMKNVHHEKQPPTAEQKAVSL